MSGRWTAVTVLLATAACLEGARTYGFRRFSGLDRQRFAGLSQTASSLAGAFRDGQPDTPTEGKEPGEEYTPSSLGDYDSSSLHPGDDTDIKRLLAHKHHHRTMAKNKRLNNRNELCLFKALRRCGNSLIAQFSTDSDFDSRCTTREEFLDCMSRMQHNNCHVKHARYGPSRALVEQYQERLRRLLRTTRGCVIGVDLSSEAE